MKAERILVATDFSEASIAAVDTAFSLAAESGARLSIVHAVDLSFGIEPNIGALDAAIEVVEQGAKESLDALIEKHSEKGVSVDKFIRSGTPAQVIAEIARETGADLVVVGSHGRGALGRLLLGSTAEKVLREVESRVLVVKQPAVAEC